MQKSAKRCPKSHQVRPIICFEPTQKARLALNLRKGPSAENERTRDGQETLIAINQAKTM